MGATDFTSFTSALEDGPHNSVHMWVGGTMSNIMISPTDPLFWMNHAQVDRLWSLWQPAHPGLGPTLSAAIAVLQPWPPATAASVKSIATLGYAYA
jgi:tyrosinase